MKKRSAAFYVTQAECDRLREEHRRELAAKQRAEYLAQLQREHRADLMERIYGIKGELYGRNW